MRGPAHRLTGSRGPLRVLSVSQSSLLNGAQRSLLDLAAGLRTDGVDLRVATPDGPLAERLRDANVPVVAAAVPWWTERQGARRAWPWQRAWRGVLARRRTAAAAKQLHATLGAWRPDVVHSNVLATGVGHALARRLGVPHVWHLREAIDADMGYRFLLGRRATLRRVRRAGLVLCNSEATRARFAPHLGATRVEVVYNGFRFAKAVPRRTAAAKPPSLLLVGTLHPGKGHLLALAALAELKERKVACRLQVVGSGSATWSQRLRAEADRLGVADRVDWLGQVADVAPLYRKAAVLLACAPNEAFGRTVVEAHDHLLPVVAAEAGGYRETVKDGVTGWTFPSGDANALADQVQAVLSKPAEARRRATAGRQRSVRLFSLDAHVARMAELFAAAAGAEVR